MNDTLSEIDWEFLRRYSPDEGATQLTGIILHHAREIIGQRDCKEMKSSHPWLNQEIIESIEAKHEAEGTDLEKIMTEQCSQQNHGSKVGLYSTYQTRIKEDTGSI